MRLSCEGQVRPVELLESTASLHALRYLYSTRRQGRIRHQRLHISRRFSDEFVANTRVKELEEEVRQLLVRVEEYRQRGPS
jgi:hypothetical protein